jgi:hypothetical protein
MQRIRFSRYIEGYIEPMTLSSHAPHHSATIRLTAARIAIRVECGGSVALSRSSPRHPNAEQAARTYPPDTIECTAR